MAGLAGEKFFDDVGAGRRIGRRRDRDELEIIADRSRRPGEAKIFGPEIMPPLRDAMRLVDGEDRGSRGAEKVWRIRTREPLRGDIEEAIAAAPEPSFDRRIVFAAVGGIQGGGGDTARLQLRDLVAHQRDQRRDDDGEPLPEDRGQLIEKRFAGTGRHDREDMFAGEHGFENFFLSRPERRKTEHKHERLLRFLHLDVHGAPVSHAFPPVVTNCRRGFQPSLLPDLATHRHLR